VVNSGKQRRSQFPGSAAALGRIPLLGDPDPTRGWHDRGYLPHFDRTTVIQSVTYRLADAVPLPVAKRLMEELTPDAEPAYRKRIENYLDSGHGSCALRQPEVARLIIHHWLARDGQDYRLHAWVVMPNHVHVVVQPLVGHSLSTIIGAWKSITARRALKSLSRSGAFWQPDYWDRFIRDETHYRNVVNYIHNNPMMARLVATPEEWPWSSATKRQAAEGGRAPRELQP
jgi:REP element-mobilizing transposase RayT